MGVFCVKLGFYYYNILDRDLAAPDRTKKYGKLLYSVM